MSNMIEIYGRDNCRFCAAAQAFCSKRGYAYVYHNMTHRPALRAEFDERTGGAQLVPQIFIGPHRIGGFEDLRRADEAGVIQTIIGGH